MFIVLQIIPRGCHVISGDCDEVNEQRLRIMLIYVSENSQSIKKLTILVSSCGLYVFQQDIKLENTGHNNVNSVIQLSNHHRYRVQT